MCEHVLVNVSVELKPSVGQAHGFCCSHSVRQFCSIKGELGFPRPRKRKDLFHMDKKQELAAGC